MRSILTILAYAGSIEWVAISGLFIGALKCRAFCAYKKLKRADVYGIRWGHRGWRCVASSGLRILRYACCSSFRVS